MTVARLIDPQLDREDLEEIRATRHDFMAARRVPIDLVTKKFTGADQHFGTPVFTEEVVRVSGVVQEVEDEDRLLRLGGRIRVGDMKLVLHHENAERIGLDRIRESVVVVPAGPSGTRYLPDVVEFAGLGLPNRVELGLVLE